MISRQIYATWSQSIPRGGTFPQIHYHVEAPNSFRTVCEVHSCRSEQERPYHCDSTASRLLSEVKHSRARLVLRWGTTLESLVLFLSFLVLGVCVRSI
ncbi:hypothetical protein ACHAXH_008837 [Discostella pseudostelligera]